MKNKLWGLIIGTVLTVFFMVPLFTHFSNHLSSRQDGLLVAWLIDWGSTALLNGSNFFNAPFFHPYQQTMAYSDLFFSTAVLNIPLKLIGNFIAPYTSLSELNFLIINHNIHLVIGSIFTFWGQYLLGLHLFNNKKTALLSATIFNFSHLHLDYMAHLHVFLIAGIPFYTLFFLKFIQTKRLKYLWLMSGAFLYQALNSPMSGYFLFGITATTLLNKKIRTAIVTHWKKVLPFVIGNGGILAFFFFPYIAVSNQFEYMRSIRDTAHFAFSVNSFFTPELIVFVLLCVFFMYTTKNLSNRFFERKKYLTIFSHHSLFSTFILIMVLGGVLLLGPVLKINDQTVKILGLPIPLPYGAFYYLIPGFKAFRASSRWIIVFAFGLSIVIGYLATIWSVQNKKKSPHTLSILLYSTIFFLWISQVPFLKLFKITTIVPPIYTMIKERPEKVLAEFPTYVWSQMENYYREADRLLYQSYHQKKLYNGFSGFAPPERENLWHTISERLSEPEIIKHLKDSEVELVLVHTNEYTHYQELTADYYQLITCQNHSCLYKLH